MCVSTIMLLILATVWGLHTCEFLVINKSCLLTSVSDTQGGGIKFSSVSAVQEIATHLFLASVGLGAIQTLMRPFMKTSLGLVQTGPDLPS